MDQTAKSAAPVVASRPAVRFANVTKKYGAVDRR